MSLTPKGPAFEQVFEAWLNQNTASGDDFEPEDEVVDNGAKIPCDYEGEGFSPVSTEGSSTPRQLIGNSLVCRHAKLKQGKRFHAYKAVVKKYSRKGWFHSKKSSLSPGSQTDDSGVVSPGVDASMETGKDPLVEGSDGCLSGNDSPPNIQDDFANGGIWVGGMPCSQRLGSDCLEQPPKLLPSLVRVDNSLVDHGKTNECLLVVDHGLDKSSQNHKRTTSPESVCHSVNGDYNFVEGNRLHENRKESRLSSVSETNRTKRVKSILDTGKSLTVIVSSSSGNGVPGGGDTSICMKTTLSGDSDNTGYVQRNGCEVGASDSGAGSQSESCCEESPHHVSTGHIKTPQFPCENHRFTVIPNDTSKKPNISGSPPLVLKLKKCEQESNVKDSPPRYFAVEVVDKSKNVEVVKIDKSVILSHSRDTESHVCHVEASSRTKRVKAGRRTSGMCPCCVVSKSQSTKKRRSRSLSSKCSHSIHTSDPGKNPLETQQNSFIRQCVHLSILQTKVHTLFHHLFPRLQPVLSQVSPEGVHFARIMGDVIGVLQQAETADNVMDAEDISGGLENMTLRGDNCAERMEPVFEPSIVLCRSPEQCLEDFREKIFVLVQLLLPKLTLSVDNNCYRSHRDLLRFLNKIIAQNCTDASQDQSKP